MPWDSMNSWKAFSASCHLWKHFPCKKNVEMLEEVVVGWCEVKWIWWMRQNLIAQFFQLSKHWLCSVWLGIIIHKNCTLSVDKWHCKHCSFQHISSIAEHTSQMQWFLQDSESCSGSDRQQTTKQWPWFFFFYTSLALGSTLELLLQLSWL